MTDPNDPAFPDNYINGQHWVHHGLTKREYFAAMALIARSLTPAPRLISNYTKEAVEMADALIAELNKEQKQ